MIEPTETALVRHLTEDEMFAQANLLSGYAMQELSDLLELCAMRSVPPEVCHRILRLFSASFEAGRHNPIKPSSDRSVG
jgi:hypothetical protein